MSGISKTTELKSKIFVLNSLTNRFDGKFLSDLNLSVTQAKILFLLKNGTRDEICQKDISVCFGITHSTCSEILDRLKEKGLITEYVSAKDRRRKVIKLTDAGDKICSEFNDGVKRTEKRLNLGISDEELNAFIGILNKMINNMKG